VLLIAGEGLSNVLLLPVQLRSPFMRCFPVYFPIFTVDVVFLRRATCLTSELTVSGNPIEGLV
jgi:hypothetical protein